MITGKRNSSASWAGFIRYTFAGLLGLSVFLSLPAAATPWNLHTLLAGFGRISSAKARYTEIRNSGFVDVPMIEHGSLTYLAPDYLAKLASDGSSGYVVRGNVAEILGSKPPRRLHLDNYPPLAAIVAALRATLSGNAKILHRYFHIRLSGNAAAWHLTLTPFRSSLMEVISSITIHGATNRIQRVEIRQNDGDDDVLKLQQQVIRERQPTTP